MRKVFLGLCYLTCLLLFTRCEYQFSEDYFKKIEVTEPTFSFSLTNFTNGEVLTRPKNIRYNYNAEDKHALFLINFKINNQLVEEKRQKSGDFFLDISNLEDKTHTLKIEYFFKSGTGSLADLNNAEIYKVEEEFTFSVDKTVVPINVSKVEHKDGTIFVSWDVPDNTSKYLEAFLIIQEGYNRREISLLENDLIQKGIFKDSLTTKFKVDYQIGVRNDYNERFSEVNKFTIKDSLITFDHEILDINSYKITWNEHPLYSNFDNYKLTYGGTEKTVSNRGGELIVNSTFIFGIPKSYSLKMERDEYIPFNINIYKSATYGTPIEKTNYNSLLYNENTDYFYATKVNTDIFPFTVDVFKLNPDDFSINKKITFETSGFYFAADTLFDNDGNLVVDLREKSLVINATNLNIEKTVYLTDYNANLSSNNTKTRYRDGVVIIDNDYTFKDILIYDTNSKQLLKTLRKEFASVSSQDFNYFTVERDIYKINGNSIDLIYKLPSSEPPLFDIGFIPSKNSLVIQVGGSSGNAKECLFLDLNTNTTSSIAGTEKTSYFNYDAYSKKLLFLNRQSSQNNKASVLNLQNNELKTLEVAGNGFGRKYFFYKNGLYLLNFNFYLKDHF